MGKFPHLVPNESVTEAKTHEPTEKEQKKEKKWKWQTQADTKRSWNQLKFLYSQQKLFVSCCATYRVVSQIDLWFQCLNCQWNMELQRLSADIMCRTRHVFRQPHIFRHAHIHGLSCSSTIFFSFVHNQRLLLFSGGKKRLKIPLSRFHGEVHL